MARQESYTVTRSQPFAAVIRKSKVDGSAALVVTSKKWYQHCLNKFADGTQATLEVHTRKPKRTEQQNRYYWGVYLPIIAQETGESDLEALHELFKGKFLAEGIVEVLGEKVRKKRSTTDLGVADFCQYILDIEAMTGIAAPPTENWELAPLREGVKEKDHGKKPDSGDEGGEAGSGDGGSDRDEHREAVAPSARAAKREPAKKGSRRASRKRDADAAGDGGEGPRGD